MKLSFPVPSTPHPVGGVAITYEFATALAHRGHHVTLLHHELFGGDAVTSLDELAWFAFDETVDHHFVDSSAPTFDALPDADIFVAHGQAIDENPRLGLPVAMIQGWQMYPSAHEIATFRAHAPKACVARWLIRKGRELGVDERELVHTPIALHHDRFQLREPIEDRRPHVLFCWNPHPTKGGDLAIQVLGRLHEARPDVRLSAFGTWAPPEIPSWLTYHREPEPGMLVDELYNTASVFLCSSVAEGFGLTNLEAMTCGAALVTTDCGGPEDYAEQEVTALVSPTKDADALLAAARRALDDDTLRTGIARAGRDRARGFTWERSGALMEAFFAAYLADPEAFGR